MNTTKTNPKTEEEITVQQKTLTKETEQTPITKKSILPWKNGKPLTKENTKEPVLFLIRDNHDIEIKEGIMPGRIEITKTDNKQAEIILSKSKLLKLPNGLTIWIASESEATAYPTNTKHDSHALFQYIRQIIANYKSLEAGKWGNRAKFALYFFLGLAAIIAAIGLFKVDLTPYIPWATKTVTSTVQTIPQTTPPVIP